MFWYKVLFSLQLKFVYFKVQSIFHQMLFYSHWLGMTAAPPIYNFELKFVFNSVAKRYRFSVLPSVPSLCQKRIKIQLSKKKTEDKDVAVGPTANIKYLYLKGSTRSSLIYSSSLVNKSMSSSFNSNLHNIFGSCRLFCLSVYIESIFVG